MEDLDSSQNCLLQIWDLLASTGSCTHKETHPDSHAYAQIQKNLRVVKYSRHGGPLLLPQRQLDLCELGASLVNTASFSPARAAQWDSISKNK